MIAAMREGEQEVVVVDVFGVAGFDSRFLRFAADETEEEVDDDDTGGNLACFFGILVSAFPGMIFLARKN